MIYVKSNTERHARGHMHTHKHTPTHTEDKPLFLHLQFFYLP